MLGTPPAFVLSQDQTLKKLYLNDVSVAQIIFRIICLANILKNFRWLKIRLHDILNNSLIVQGVIVCLYVIQFTRYSVRCFALADSLFILAHSSSFVKNFFQVFSNFFEVFRSLVVLANNFAMLAHLLPFVKHFFKILQISD